MKMTPIQKRAARKARNGPMVDLNLVSLIDVFTILIFFLLSNSSDPEVIPVSGAVHLPESTAQKAPKETLVVVVSNAEITVDGRKVAGAADIAKAGDDLILPLKAALDQLASQAGTNAADAAKPKSVTILGDKDIPYQLLRKVMYTCAVANYADVAFAVNRKA